MLPSPETLFEEKLRNAYQSNYEDGNASRILMCNYKRDDGSYIYKRGRCGGKAKYCLRHSYAHAHTNRERLITTFKHVVQHYLGTKFYSITAVCSDTDLHTNLRQNAKALNEGLRAIHSALRAYASFGQVELTRSTLCPEYGHPHMHLSTYTPYRTISQNQLEDIWHDAVGGFAHHLDIQQFTRSALLAEIARAESKDGKFNNIFAYNTKPFVLGLDQFEAAQLGNVIQSLKGLKLNNWLHSSEYKQIIKKEQYEK